MITAIIGIVIGILIAAAGIYYLNQDRGKKDTVKIYGTITAVGVIVFVVALLMLIL